LKVLIQAFLKYEASTGRQMNTGGTIVTLPVYSLGRPAALTHLQFYLCFWAVVGSKSVFWLLRLPKP